MTEHASTTEKPPHIRVGLTALFAKLVCWWFGCDPDYSPQPNTSAIPCKRCGAFDVSYSDCVGDTRHARLCERVCFWRWIIPSRCRSCGKRFGKHDGCLPF